MRWTINRISAFTRTDQKFGSLARSSLWNENPGVDTSSCRSKAVVFTAFCSCAVSFDRLSVNVSAIRNSIALTLPFSADHRRASLRYAWQGVLQESSLIGSVEVKLLLFLFRIASPPRGSLASLRGRRWAAA